jgi:hypothetical protein
MIKKTMTYTDFNNNERTEDFYFNLTEAEVTEMEMSTEGGLEQMLQRIINAKDTPEIIRWFKRIVLKAYGEKSPDGRYFQKSAELSEKFSYTQAYSDLFMELATNAEAALEFVNGIIPTKEKVTLKDGKVTALPAGN